jgi:hypothetical protein
VKNSAHGAEIIKPIVRLNRNAQERIEYLFAIDSPLNMIQAFMDEAGPSRQKMACFFWILLRGHTGGADSEHYHYSATHSYSQAFMRNPSRRIHGVPPH